MLHLVEVAFDDESLEDDSDEAFNAVVGAQGMLWTNVLTMQISDVLKLNRTRTHLLHPRVVDSGQNQAHEDGLCWYDSAATHRL